METDLIYGIHAVAAALRKCPGRIRLIQVMVGAVNNVRLSSLLEQASMTGVKVEYLSSIDMGTRTRGAAHQGIIAWLKPDQVWGEHDLAKMIDRLKEPALLLILDCVQDPHNLGACLRTADAAGAHAVIVPRDRAVGLTAAVRKVACGAAENVPLVPVTNLARSLRALKDAGLWLIGTAGEAETSLYKMDLRGPLAWVMGAEGKGLRRLTRECCDALVHIPMHGTVESLNVAVAAGIGLFEVIRQRDYSK